MNDEWAVLAGVRFLLAVVVVQYHYPALPLKFPLPWPQETLAMMDGKAAVFGFFLISGYSIAASLDHRKEGFFERRFWRLYPLLLAGLAWAAVPYLFSVNGTITLGDAKPFPAGTPLGIASNLIALPYIIAPSLPTYGVTWSLTCEVLYYAAAPWLMRTKTAYIAGLVILSVVAYFVHARYFTSPLPDNLYAVTPTILAWIWLLGFLIYRHRPTAAVHLAAAFVVFGVYIAMPNAFAPNTWFTLTTVLLALAIGNRVPLAAQLRPILLWLGDVSYPLYLTHMATFIVMYKLWGVWLERRLPLYCLGCLMVAVLFYYAIDLPARSFRNTLRAARAST